MSSMLRISKCTFIQFTHPGEDSICTYQTKITKEAPYRKTHSTENISGCWEYYFAIWSFISREGPGITIENARRDVANNKPLLKQVGRSSSMRLEY